MSKKITKIIGFIIGIVIIGFLIKILYNNIANLQQYTLSINYLYLTLSFLLLLIIPFITTITWIIMLRAFKEKLSFLKTFNVLNLSALIRYIPGNIVYIIGRARLFKKHSISQITSTILIFTELAITIVASSLIALSLGIIQADISSIPLFWILLLIGLILVGMHPSIFNKGSKKIYKIIKKKELEVNWKYKTILQLFSIQLLNWVIQSISFFFLVKAVFDVPLSFFIPITAIFTLSWVLAFLSFISPAGIGIREGLLVLFLQSIVPLEIAIILSILSRLLIIASEILFATISLYLKKIEV
jgi:glycosyltransferase 2 family protein